MKQHGRVGGLARLVNSTPLSFRATFVQPAFRRRLKLYMSTHEDAHCRYADTHTHTDPSSDITPHHCLLPNLQSPPWEITKSLSSHQGVKYTPLKSNRGGWRDSAVGVAREAASVRAPEKEDGGMRATALEGEDGVLIGRFGWREMELKTD